MGRPIPARTIPATTARRTQAIVTFESDDTVRRIEQRYEDGSTIVVEGAALAEKPKGSPRSWREIAERLGADADGHAAS